MSEVKVDSDAIANLVKITQSLGEALAGLIPKEPKKRGRPRKNTGMCPNCSEAYMYCACADNPLNTKKKQTVEKYKPTNVIVEDTVGEESPEEILAYKPPVEKKNNNPSYIATAKRANFTPPNGDKKYGHTQAVTDGPRQQKFVDFANVGDRIPSEKYPERSERRPGVKKIKFYCSKGNHEFEAYPSEYPNAFAKFGVAEIGIKDDKPRVVCDQCMGN